MHNFHNDVDAHNTTTPSDDGDHASTQSGHNDPSGDNSHSVIPSGSNGGSGPSRRRSGHSDGHAGSVGGLTPGGTSGTGNVSSHARSGHDDGCISVHGLTSSSDGGRVSDGNLGDGHVGTTCGLSPTSENREADPSEMVIPILIEDDEGGYLVGDVEQFIMVTEGTGEQASGSKPEVPPSDITEVIESLKKNVSPDEEEIVVRRGPHFLRDALKRAGRRSFKPTKTIRVEFVGESGSDTGGVSREFFTLLGKAIQETYMESSGCFMHNAVALQENSYFKLGQLVAIATVQGGSGFCFFSPSVYRYLCGVKISDIKVEVAEVPDEGVRRVLEQIQACLSVEALRETAMEHDYLLTGSGFTKPLALLKMEDKTSLIHAVTFHHVLLHTKGELDQFIEGLGGLGVREALEEYPSIMEPFFTIKGIVPLTADSMRKMFENIHFSEKGSTAREKEENAYMMFLNYLDECENAGEVESGEGSAEELEPGERHVTLATVLMFFTGAEQFPPLGFGPAILTFNPDNPYPTASTCAIQLCLPTKYTAYEKFCHIMNTAMVCHGGFGLH